MRHHTRRIALASAAALALVHPAYAASYSWDAGFGNWNTAANWAPSGPPGAADVAWIGNLPSVENDFVQLNVNATVAGLNISDGMVLNSNGFRLTVNGNALVSGRNQTQNVIFPSRIQVRTSGAGTYDVDVNDLTVNDNAAIDMMGGTLEVDGTLHVAYTASLRGDGIVNLKGNGSPAFLNDGFLQPGTGGLTLNQLGTGRIDLDGVTNNNDINITTANFVENTYASLTVNGDQLTDSYGGQLWIGGGNALNMNLSNGWTADTSSLLRFSGGAGDPPAQLNGGHITLRGTVEVQGIAAINAPSTWDHPATVSITNNDELRLSGPATFGGASFSQAPATANGRITNNGGLTVQSSTTVDLPTGTFDWDGAAASAGTTLLPGVTFTLNVGSIDASPAAAYAGLTTVGTGATLAVNTPAPWTLDGAIALEGATLTGAGVVTRAAGLISGRGAVNVASLANDGTLAAVDGTLLVTATGPIDLDGSSNAGDLRAVSGNLTVQNVAGLAPFAGELRVGSNGTPSTFLMPTGGLDNTGVITLNGGTYQARLAQAGRLNVNFNSRIVGPARFAPTGTNAVNALLELDGESVVEAGAAFNGTGTVQVLPPSHLTAHDQAAMGVPLHNAGRVSIGRPIGLFSVAAFSNLQTGTLAVDLLSDAGALGVDHDLLDVRDVARLAGTLEVSYAEGFTPSLGDSFLVIRTLGGVIGTFDQLVQPPLPGGLQLLAVYDAYTVTLTTIPEPAAALTVAAGAILSSLFGRSRRSR